MSTDLVLCPLAYSVGLELLYPRQQISTNMSSSALPFGQDIALDDVSGPTYLTAQTLVQQVAYALSDKLFAYSPETFDLDVAAKAWSAARSKNAFGEATEVKSLQTRHGAGSIGELPEECDRLGVQRVLVEHTVARRLPC